MLRDARTGCRRLQIWSVRDNRAPSMRPTRPLHSPTLARCCAVLLLLVGVASVARADWLAPLTVETAATLPSGQIDFALGASYFRNRRFPAFTPSGFIHSQNLTQVPELGVRGAIGDMVEIQASYEFINNDENTQDGHLDNYGGGDARLFTKIYALRERKWIPAMGFRFGTKLPNANSSKHLGTDTIDWFIQWLGSKQIGPVALYLNLGIALLDNPHSSSEGGGGQDDLFTYAFGIVSPMFGLDSAGDWNIRLMTEAAGQTGSRFDNDGNDVRAGFQVIYGDFTLYAGASAGLNSAAEKYGVMGGLIYAFNVDRLAPLFED